MNCFEEYECKHCRGICEIKMVKETEKATEPMIEFCPFCGMADHYAVEKDE